MKTSQIAVLSALGLIVVCMIIVIGLGRIAVGSAITTDGRSHSLEIGVRGETTKVNLDYAGFEGIVIDGAWQLRVEQAAEYSVELEYPGGAHDRPPAFLEGDSLVLGGDGDFGSDEEDYIARIRMPALGSIRIDGAGDAIFTGFDEPGLTIAIDGAGRVKGTRSSVGKLDVSLEGLGQVDLEDTEAVDASVLLNGAGEIRLRMNGGVLEGRLEGLGSIRYSGDVSDERVIVEGLGKVKRL